MKNSMMPKTALLISLAFLLPFQQVSAASEKRLAFSKSAGIEVLASGDNWCGEQANIVLKANDKSFFSSDDISVFMAKVGAAVLPKECPEASSVNVVGKKNGSEAVLFNGIATKAGSWKLVDSKATRQSADNTVTASSSDTPATEEKKPTGNIADSEAMPEVPEAITETIVTTDNKADTQPLPKQSSDTQTELSAQKNNVEGATEIVASHQPKPENFSVGNYKPRLASRSFEYQQTAFDATPTIDGCSVNTISDRFSQDLVAFPDGDFTCQDNRLNGVGAIEFKNSDARKVAAYNIQAIDGFLFENLPDGWIPQLLTERDDQGILFKDYRNIAIFHVNSDRELKTHFIGVMTSDGQTYSNPKLYAITDRQIILDETKIGGLLDAFVASRKDSGIKNWGNDFIKVFESLDDIKTDTVGITTNRRWSNRDQFEVRNYTVEREQKRLAEIERQKEAERIQQVQREQQMRKDFARFNELDADQLKSAALGNYLAQFSESYYREAAAGALGLSNRKDIWMIHVDDVSDQQLEIDFPTEMPGNSSEITTEGWYIVTAYLSGVLGETDSSGYIQPKLEKISIKTACAQEQCNEFTDPVMLIRQKYNMPNWSPEQKQGQE